MILQRSNGATSRQTLKPLAAASSASSRSARSAWATRADRLLGRRVEHGDGLARLARTPLAVDEQLGVGIGHETFSCCYCRRWRVGESGAYDRSPTGLQSRSIARRCAGAERFRCPRHVRTEITAETRLHRRAPRNPACRVTPPSATSRYCSAISARISRCQAAVGCRHRHHQPALGAQLAEEIEHEADVAVLRVELRLVEQMHHRRTASATARARPTAPACGSGAPDRTGDSGSPAGRARDI